MLEFAARARTIQWELKELGEEASDRAVLMTLLSGLPPDYLITVGILEAKKSTFEAAMPALITAEQRIAMQRDHRTGAVRDTGVTLAAAEDITCYGCGRRGHIQRQCRSSGPGSGSRPPSWGPGKGQGDVQRPLQARASRAGAGRNYGFRRNNPASGRGPRPNPDGGDAHALSAVAQATPTAVDAPEMAVLCADRFGSNVAEQSAWLIDSGASHHMTHTLANMIATKKINAMPINMANGDTHFATHSGRVLIHTNTADGENQLMLTNAHHVPGLAANHLSVPRAVQSGSHMSFTGTGVSITFQGKEVASGHARRGIYCSIIALD